MTYREGTEMKEMNWAAFRFYLENRCAGLGR